MGTDPRFQQDTNLASGISRELYRRGPFGDAIGCIRSSRLNTGERFQERLLALSDRDHICTYTMLKAPLPLTDYISTIQLLPVTDPNETYAQWACEFNCAPGVEPDMLNTVRSVYQAGLDFLKDHFSR